MTLRTKNSDHRSLFSEDSTGLILLRHGRPWGSVSWPDIGPPFTRQPLLSILPLQRYAYHVAKRRGCNVDQPRNLAKSVTVE